MARDLFAHPWNQAERAWAIYKLRTRLYRLHLCKTRVLEVCWHQELFDTRRWRMRVVSEVEYWWERAEDHCMLNWKSLTVHQHNILYSLTFLEPRKICYRLNLYTTGVPNICWQQEYIYTRAGEDTGGFGDRILGEEGWWSMHFHFITHANSLKTTSVILPAKVKRISNPIFTSDLEIGFLASRNGSSGHLLN